MSERLTPGTTMQEVYRPTSDGPPIARAHTNLAKALQHATAGVAMTRIESPYVRRLNALIAELYERGDDWEDEWPK